MTRTSATRLALSLALGLTLLSGCAKGELLAPGARAPELSLRDQTGVSRSLASFRGAPLLVYLYPKDGTPG